MSNCHHLFKKFIDNISIPTDKRDRMIVSKDKLRETIRKYFKDKHPEYIPQFFIQGSYKMKTAIRTKDDICDLDDGVYFLRNPDVTSTTLQSWVLDAVNGYTSTVPEHRKKCIRTVFAADYEIDYPVYYKIDDKECQIAVKNTGWEDSDPKAVVDWFNNNKDEDGQLIIIVKALKAWCDNIRNQMPSGLAMTILAVLAKDKIVYNERYDITLRDTLKEIKRILNSKFECIVPAAPKDNLFEGYSEDRKDNFLNALNKFIEDADSAIREKNELKASKFWRTHLGTLRFPEGEDKNEDEKLFAAIATGAKTSNPWASK